MQYPTCPPSVGDKEPWVLATWSLATRGQTPLHPSRDTVTYRFWSDQSRSSSRIERRGARRHFDSLFHMSFNRGRQQSYKFSAGALTRINHAGNHAEIKSRIRLDEYPAN